MCVCVCYYCCRPSFILHLIRFYSLSPHRKRDDFKPRTSSRVDILTKQQQQQQNEQEEEKYRKHSRFTHTHENKNRMR